ncbi:Imm74 family immunity protein [Methylocella sp.]|uniref:Imm74 family immunity protein n=1 Tax=Methylocella sp. TaxID=1978226 RepID=UPI0035AF7FF6
MSAGGRRGGPKVALTEGAVRVAWGERRLVIVSAPQPPNVQDPADFLVDMDELLNWGPPHESVEISVDELQAIMRAIEAEFDRLGLAVEFE